MIVGPLNGALNEAEALTAAGSGAAALNFKEVEWWRPDETGLVAAALTGPGDLEGAVVGSGEGFGGVGEEAALSAAMDARGGKHRRVRCSST